MITYGHHVANKTPDSTLSARPVHRSFRLLVDNGILACISSARPPLVPGTHSVTTQVSKCGTGIRVPPATDPAAGVHYRYPAAWSSNNHIQLYNSLTGLASSGSTTSPWRSHSSATCPPCADRYSSYPVCLRNASKREPTRFGVVLWQW
jgi:hypothetical protein